MTNSVDRLEPIHAVLRQTKQKTQGNQDTLLRLYQTFEQMDQQQLQRLDTIAQFRVSMTDLQTEIYQIQTEIRLLTCIFKVPKGVVWDA